MVGSSLYHKISVCVDRSEFHFEALKITIRTCWGLFMDLVGQLKDQGSSSDSLPPEMNFCSHSNSLFFASCSSKVDVMIANHGHLSCLVEHRRHLCDHHTGHRYSFAGKNRAIDLQILNG